MSMEQLPYLNNSLPVSGRVDDLLSRMTLEEKVGQMMQTDAREDLEGDILRVGVGSILHVSPENIVRAHELTRQTRLHIPVLIGEDCIHGYSFWKGATIYPTQLGMAASWDPSLLERVARATAQEVSPTGVHWTFSPVLCIARDLRWGRVGETFGEDPFLIGELASAMVRGIPGRRPAGQDRNHGDGEAFRRVLGDPGRARCQRGGCIPAQAALLVSSALRTGRQGRLPRLHARLPVD
jgi:beta-glucosidase